MNKKYTQLVPLVIFAAVAIFIIIIVAISSGRYNQYRETIDENKNDKSTIEQHEKEISDIFCVAFISFCSCFLFKQRRRTV